jgi:hypothetical protein
MTAKLSPDVSGGKFSPIVPSSAPLVDAGLAVGRPARLPASGGEVADDVAATVGFGDAVVDQTHR